MDQSSQEKKLNNFYKKEKDILQVALTRGGYLSIDYRRKSKEYPYGRSVIGRRGGWISTYIAKDYNSETHSLVDAFESSPDTSGKWHSFI